MEWHQEFMAQAAQKGEPVRVPVPWGASGDGFVFFPNGERRWGLHGASGVFIRHVDTDGIETFFLAQRGDNVEGGRSQWALPGGALESGETPVQGALREFREEIEIDIQVDVLGHHAQHVHETWAYTTVVVQVSDRFQPPDELQWENKAAGWFTRQEIAELETYDAFNDALEYLFGIIDSENP
ncbi:MAG: NUDIX domain-containing protein [Actinobacteria bacterium]|nr:NUDIX domain-containing protein [Actinomycetota bacterium]MTB28554.1 NUDIX domain-containing protein [Actinomycetota bacterium]